MAAMPKPGANPALDAETQRPILVGMSVAFAAAAFMVVSLRLYTRQFIVKAVGADDWTILAATILSIGVSVITILQADYGLGLHVWMVDLPTTMKQLKALFANEVIYNLAQILTKISFLMQYRRIFKDTMTRRVALGMMIYLVFWGVAQEFLVGLACSPIADIIPSRKAACIETLIVWYLTSVMNIVTDFIIFLTPMRAIKNLQLRRKQKIMVAGIFCLGFFTCILSIVRLFTIRAAINTTDPTWDNVPVAYWSVVELNSGILCASIATLRPLLRRIASHGASSAYPYPGAPHSKGSSGARTLTTTLHSTSAPDPYALADMALDSQEGLRSEGGKEERGSLDEEEGGMGLDRELDGAGAGWPVQGGFRGDVTRTTSISANGFAGRGRMSRGSEEELVEMEGRGRGRERGRGEIHVVRETVVRESRPRSRGL